MEPSPNKLYYYSLKLLSVRDRTEKELNEKLKNKGYDEQDIRLVIEKLKEQGYINDYKFALNWVKMRSERKLLGSLRLEQELRAKGIDEEIINSCLAHIDDSLAIVNIKKLLEKNYPDIRKGDLKMIKKAFNFTQRYGYRNKDFFKALELISKEDLR